MVSNEMVIEDKKYTPDEVFELLGKENLILSRADHKHTIVVDGFDVYARSLRYMTFYQKGLVCVKCGKVGTHFYLCGHPNTNRRHFNLFADDGTLMTKDHVIPKSKGGEDSVINMQTMCTHCNKEKGNDCDLKVKYLVATHINGTKSIEYKDVQSAVCSILGVRWKSMKLKTIVKNIFEISNNINNAINTGSTYMSYKWKYIEK